MTSLFRSLWKGNRPVFENALGEPVQFRPQTDSELVVLGADPNRPVRDLIGIFDDKVQVARPVGSGANTHQTADITVEQTQIEFDEDLFPTALDLPREGDVLVLTDRAEAPRFQIESVEPDRFAKVVCIVAPLS